MADDVPYTGRLPKRLDIDSGVPGLTLTHHITSAILDADCAPADGCWHVTHTASDRKIDRTSLGFRSLHAAAHMAQRLESLADWTLPADQLPAEGLGDQARHAEAHAHEIDASWPAGATIPSANGPSIVDHTTGDLRLLMAGAPSIDWDEADDGTLTCTVCGIRPAHGTEDHTDG